MCFLRGTVVHIGSWIALVGCGLGAYSLTLHNKSGERIVGFDNAHPVPTQSGPAGKKRIVNDHKHRFKTIRPYDYKDAATLLEDFWAQVDAVLKEEGVTL
jgi:hypothetical protein